MQMQTKKNVSMTNISFCFFSTQGKLLFNSQCILNPIDVWPQDPNILNPIDVWSWDPNNLFTIDLHSIFIRL